jgi:uncharacterized protein (DUF433 family)
MITVPLTTAEVAALFDLDERRIRKEVEQGVFGAMSGPPRFHLAEVVHLVVVAASGLDLAIEDRKRIYRTIATSLSAKRPRELALGAYLFVKLAAAAQAIDARVSEFQRWKAKLIERADVLGGEPVFPRTQLSVRHIGELVRRGASVARVAIEHPTLSTRDVELAKCFATAYPRRGRPRSPMIPRAVPSEPSRSKSLARSLSRL